MDVIPIALKNVVLFETNFNVQIARWAPIGARFPVARAANAHATVNACGNLHFECFLLFELALTAASGTGFSNHLAIAATGGASLLHAEKALAHLHLPRARTGATGFGLRACFGATAMAQLTIVPAGDANLGVFALGGLLQGDFHGIAQIAAPENLASTAARASALLAKHVTKNVTKSFRKATHVFATSATPHVGIDTRKTVLVVSGPLLRVRQHFVGFLGFLEFFFGHLGGVALIAVRVVLHRVFAIGLFDFVVRRVLGNPKNLVKISFCHCFSCPVSIQTPRCTQSAQRGAYQQSSAQALSPS